MKIVRLISQPAAIFLTIYILLLSGPFQSAWAAMIDTESVRNASQSHITRDDLNNLLARQDIQLALVSQGVNPQEAKTWIESLSEAELNDIVNRLDQLPAAAGETSILIALLLFIILVILDIAGIINTPG